MGRRTVISAQAMEMAQLALKLAENTKNQAALAQAFNILGVLARRQRHPAQAIQHLTKSLEMAETMPDPGVRVAALNNLADLFHAAGQKTYAMEELKKAVVIFAEIGVETGSMKSEIWMLTEW
ncbi:MAG: hypothetical protein KAS38_06535 [Anaerolineales bacterium]|nr:hypothetical protein [Anaerolineales bacterium]MCK4976409.1 hypothetical protein [Anaerolineales bacterium]MCK5430371.1 hypothetical protein [Anaerolineales bacterium]